LRALHSFPTRRSSDLIGAIDLGVMNRDPLHGPGRTHRVEQQLVLRARVAVWVLVVHWHEYDGVAVDGDLERLQFAVSQIAPIQRSEEHTSELQSLAYL